MYTHMFTPISLTRYGGDLYDLDPLYNNTCTSGRDACAEGCECCCAQSNSSCDYAAHGLGLSGSFNLTTCVGANTHDHLDYGVTSFLYDGAFARGSRPTILAEMFPITPKRLGRGIVVGQERVVTKLSGSYSLPELPAAAALIVLTYSEGLLDSRVCCAVGSAEVKLERGQVAIIRQATPDEQSLSLGQKRRAVAKYDDDPDVASQESPLPPTRISAPFVHGDDAEDSNHWRETTPSFAIRPDGHIELLCKLQHRLACRPARSLTDARCCVGGLQTSAAATRSCAKPRPLPTAATSRSAQR